ncbi:MAG: hypothetical protein ACOC3U_05295 [Thiohalospira sp.]
MWRKIDNYVLNWHNHPRRGAIHLRLDDGSEAVIDHLSSDDLSTLGNILRVEPNVWYHTTRGDIAAHSRPEHEENID